MSEAERLVADLRDQATRLRELQIQVVAGEAELEVERARLVALSAEHDALCRRVAESEARAEAAENALRVLRHRDLCNWWRELHALAVQHEVPASFSVPDLGLEDPLRRLLYAATQIPRAAACWKEIERLAALIA